MCLQEKSEGLFHIIKQVVMISIGLFSYWNQEFDQGSEI